jgi:hypothetical protein
MMLDNYMIRRSNNFDFPCASERQHELYIQPRLSASSTNQPCWRNGSAQDFYIDHLPIEQSS